MENQKKLKCNDFNSVAIFLSLIFSYYVLLDFWKYKFKLFLLVEIFAKWNKTVTANLIQQQKAIKVCEISLLKSLPKKR